MKTNEIFLADSTLSFQIKKKIEAIADILINSPTYSPDLMGGDSGKILFLAYYSNYKKDPQYLEYVPKILSSIFDKVASGFNYPTFASGLAGIGWVLLHLVQNKFIKADTNKIIGGLDQFLSTQMLNLIKEGKYDYLNGSLGICLYYIYRNNEVSRKVLSKLILELERQSITMNQGIAWKSRLMLENDLEGFNLSMSHGIAGIIVLLSRLYEMGICRNKIYHLITEAVTYLESSKQDVSIFKYAYPSWKVSAGPKYSDGSGGRLAWCYNDLGISIALWQAGNILKNSSWKDEAINNLLRTTTIRSTGDSGVMDASLCHGSAGIAHVYKRMYNYTQIPDFKNSADYWYSHCLTMDIYEDGLAGYKSYNLPKYGGFKNDYGMLTGIAGIGLVMISAISPIEPKWDRALLLS